MEKDAERNCLFGQGKQAFVILESGHVGVDCSEESYVSRDRADEPLAKLNLVSGAEPSST